MSSGTIPSRRGTEAAGSVGDPPVRLRRRSAQPSRPLKATLCHRGALRPQQAARPRPFTPSISRRCRNPARPLAPKVSSPLTTRSSTSPSPRTLEAKTRRSTSHCALSQPSLTTLYYQIPAPSQTHFPWPCPNPWIRLHPSSDSRHPRLLLLPPCHCSPRVSSKFPRSPSTTSTPRTCSSSSAPPVPLPWTCTVSPPSPTSAQINFHTDVAHFCLQSNASSRASCRRRPSSTRRRGKLPTHPRYWPACFTRAVPCLCGRTRRRRSWRGASRRLLRISARRSGW